MKLIKSDRVYLYSDYSGTFDSNYLVIALCLIFFAIPTFCCIFYAMATKPKNKLNKG